jgi:hypothetical protein
LGRLIALAKNLLRPFGDITVLTQKFFPAHFWLTALFHLFSFMLLCVLACFLLSIVAILNLAARWARWV